MKQNIMTIRGALLTVISKNWGDLFDEFFEDYIEACDWIACTLEPETLLGCKFYLYGDSNRKYLLTLKFNDDYFDWHIEEIVEVKARRGKIAF